MPDERGKFSEVFSLLAERVKRVVSFVSILELVDLLDDHVLDFFAHALVCQE